MFARPAFFISIFQAALLLRSVEARIWLLERDGRAIFARRFGQEQPTVLKELAAACGGGICDALADEAVSRPHLISRIQGQLKSYFDFLDCSVVDCPARVFAARNG